MTTMTMIQTLFRAQEVRKDASLSGCVDSRRTSTFRRLAGKAVRCNSGHLWVTQENDPVDYVLHAGQSLPLLRSGKVVIGGKGCFRIDQSN